jgi:hypothetical protein
LTPSHKLRPALSLASSALFSVRRTQAPFQGGRLAAAFSAAVEADDQTSDAPCRSPRPPGRAERSTKSQDRFYRPCVNKSDFPGPKRLPSTRAPPTFAGSARHRSRSFAAAIRLPALVRLPDALAREGSILDGYVGCSPRLARTTRRLSTSAIDNDRRAQPPDRSNPAHRARGRPQAQLQQVAERRLTPPPVVLRNRVAELLFEAQPAEMSRARGTAGMSPMPASFTTIARD